jgi:hypothetical protein
VFCDFWENRNNACNSQEYSQKKKIVLRSLREAKANPLEIHRRTGTRRIVHVCRDRATVVSTTHGFTTKFALACANLPTFGSRITITMNKKKNVIKGS